MADTLQFLVKHGYVVLFASVLAQQLGLPLPSTPFIIAAGALAHSGQLSFTATLFVSCIAAKDQAGSRLLTGLSKILTNRYVIGFEIFGGFNRYFSAPGDVYEDPHGSSSGAPLEKQTNLIRLTEASIYSKWALNGAIIRLPLSDVSKAQKGTH